MTVGLNQVMTLTFIGILGMIVSAVVAQETCKKFLVTADCKREVCGCWYKLQQDCTGGSIAA